MRRVAAILFAFLLASTAFGQQKNAFSVFYNDPSYWFSSSSGGHAEGGVGVAVSHAFSPIFSTELSIARESYTLFANQAVSNGMISYDRVSVRTTPIDATARYHFVNATRWKPYIGGGLRYVDTHEIGRGTFSPRYTFRSVESEIVGGVVFQIRPRIGLIFDGKQLIGNHSLHSDPSFKGSIGFNWRF